MNALLLKGYESEHEAMLRRHNEQTALNMISTCLGVTVKVSTEDRLRGAVIEAAMFLRENAPSRALDTLEKAMKL